ncbi:potassium channel family protein [Solibacillus sp. FSL K6-1523]|uniref:potassium channel family protein n=1 Tax=Solibacillus sp. FSL K6-1523 TaxID=2921471 RepID=UPI0030F9B9A3
MKKEFVVIGLGRFGGSIVRELVKQGANVMAIDTDSERIDEFAQIATQAVVADTTEESVIKSLGIWNFEHVIVAIGENIQASILTTLILKELGVPQITVKAQNDYHEKVLRKIGADYVVHPERDMGIRIANNMMSNSVLDYLELSGEHSIVEIKASEKIAGHSLIELDIRAKYGVNIVGITRGDEIMVSPAATDRIEVGDILLVIGADVDIDRFVQKVI